MSKKELDKYLESIGGLVNGYFSDRPPITDSHFFSVGPGWYQLIHDLIHDLIELGWDKQACQVKEKFGGLRFYINGGSNEIFKRIQKAENESMETCEETGKPGKLYKINGWLKTLCEEEYNKQK